MDNELQKYIEDFLSKHSLPRDTIFLVRSESTIIPDDVVESMAEGLAETQGRPVTLHKCVAVQPDHVWVAEVDRDHVEVIKIEPR